MKKLLNYFILFLLLLTVTFVGLEAGYRIIYRLKPSIFEKKQTFFKSKLPDYGDTWRKDSLGEGGWLQPNFDDYVQNGYNGKARWKTNSFGFRNNYEIEKDNKKGKVRILSLGDSFTAGLRLDQNDFFSRLLENYFNDKKGGKQYEILTSCIEEPATGLYYYNQFGKDFHPDYLLLGITLGNDIAQSYVSLHDSGDFTMVDSSVQLSKRKNPTYGFMHGLDTVMIPDDCVEKDVLEMDEPEPTFRDKLITLKLLDAIGEYIFFYYSSYIKYQGQPIISWYYQGDNPPPRLFDAVNGFGEFLKNEPDEISESYTSLFRLLKGYQKVTERNNCKLIVIIFPQRFQVQPIDWEKTVAKYHLKKDCFDLEKPNRLIKDFCLEQKISCLDPTQSMKQFFMSERKSMYLDNGDMHWNALGNFCLFEAIKDSVYSIASGN